MGSQWSFWRLWVMWGEQGTQETRRAAALWTRWSFDIVFRGRPKEGNYNNPTWTLKSMRAWIRRWAKFWSRKLIFFSSPNFVSNFPNTYVDRFTHGINILRQTKRRIHNNSKIASQIGGLNCWLPMWMLICGKSKEYLERRWRRSVFESF